MRRLIRPATILAVLGGVLPATSALAESCYTDGDTVTIAGTVAMRTIPKDVLRGQDEYRYAVVTLDQPLCYKGFVFDDIPAAKAIGVTPIRGLPLPTFEEGSHVTLHGAIYHGTGNDRTRQDLVLEFWPP